MPRRSRLDAELVRRGLAGSRERAVELVSAGLVKVGGATATKPATAVDPGVALIVDEPAGPAARYASRGGHKLAGALDAFAGDGLTVTGRRCLDAGASTGGFTDVLLRRGATGVVAVDVGYGQLVWALQTDPRVRILDRTNVRNLRAEEIGPHVDVVVADLSFISLGLVLPALQRCALPTADFVMMVKPQFEVGRERLGTGGVVRDPQLRASAVARVAAQAQELGLGTAGVVASGLPGPAGNVEYFLWLRAGAAPLAPSALDHAVAMGPQ